nr:hypothetical protein [Tanacetum cinerariifolium]
LWWESGMCVIIGNKMHKAFPLPVMEFPLPGEVPTTSKESSHCQKKRDATAEKIALLLKSSSNCQSKSYDSYAKVAEVPTGSDSIPTAGPPATGVPTGSDVVPTVGLFFSTATVTEDFILMGSKEETERFKRKGLRLEQVSEKKLKTLKEVPEEVKATEEVPEDKVKEMMQLVPVEEVYVEALQVKHHIIVWKHLDKEDLNQLWRLVKETLSIRPPTSDKEMELWMKLKRLYELDDEDQLWTHTQNLMHASVEWKLYDTCGVHHVTSKDKEICMLVEKD